MNLKLMSLSLAFLLMTCTTVCAGFWSSVAGGIVANSITKTSTNSRPESGLDVKQTKEMKIQQALYGLGLYDDKLDGNLNTLVSRQAINTLQKKYNLKETGILSSNAQQNLLFLHELYTSLIKVNSNTPINKDERNMLYDEIDKAISLIAAGGE